MKVETLNEDKFNEVSLALYEQVLEDFIPDIVVSIATGGDYIAQKIQQKYNTECFSVKKQRKSTKQKNSIIGNMAFKLILKLPMPFLNMLRNVEHWFLMRKLKNISIGCVEPFNLEDFSGQLENKTVLIVDDALDSGITMASVKKGIENATGVGGTVRTAVIVQTTTNPVIEADYKFYHSCLVRFPWSKDVK